MERLSGLPMRTRWLLGCGTAALAAVLFWMTVGAGALLLNSTREAQPELPDPSVSLTPTAAGAMATSSMTPDSSPPTPSTGTAPATATETRTATATAVPATSTRIPPTPTATATTYVDLVCLEITHSGTTPADNQYFTATYRNQGSGEVEFGHDFRYQVAGHGATAFADQMGVELGPGDEDFTSYSMIPNFLSTPGEYTATFIADINDEVDESDESNNECQISYFLLPSGFTVAPATLAP